MDFSFKPLTSEDQEFYKKHAKGIDKAVREQFPSIPPDFPLEPVTIKKTEACGMLYGIRIRLPDGEFANVSFSEGGLQVGLKPGEEEPQSYRVYETTSASEYD